MLLYLQSDLLDCQYAIRYLSTMSHCPTKGAWQLLRHLTSYIFKTQNEVLGLSEPSLGQL